MVKNSVSHGVRYNHCPNCGERYHTAVLVDADTVERPCGCTSRRVPTRAEQAEIEDFRGREEGIIQ